MGQDFAAGVRSGVRIRIIGVRVGVPEYLGSRSAVSPLIQTVCSECTRDSRSFRRWSLKIIGSPADSLVVLKVGNWFEIAIEGEGVLFRCSAQRPEMNSSAIDVWTRAKLEKQNAHLRNRSVSDRNRNF